MIEKYVVSGPVRVGGNLLANIIASTDRWVVHTHNSLLEFDDYTKVALVMVDRRDKFAALMSNCIAWRTGQTTSYDQTDIIPFMVPEHEFRQQYLLNRQQAQPHDLSRPYARVEMFWYEDFVNNHSYVIDRLNLKTASKIFGLPINPKNTVTAVPAPYNYKDLIINHLEMKELYDQLVAETVANS